MVFDSRKPPPQDEKPKSRFSDTDLEITFRRVTCYRCGHTAVYKYRIKQLRRAAEIATGEDEQIREDHVEMWETVPRYAEIPETVKCKKCREVLGLYTECIF